MIEIKGIHKEFEGRVVLDGINGTFHKGKTNMIIGGSGTGKSVLLKCMIGILTPEKGEVLYDGRDFVKADQDTVKRFVGKWGSYFKEAPCLIQKRYWKMFDFPWIP